jgi:hypothetical protein
VDDLVYIPLGGASTLEVLAVQNEDVVLQVKNYVLILYGKHLKRARPSQWDVDHELESVKFQLKDVHASSPIAFLQKHTESVKPDRLLAEARRAQRGHVLELELDGLHLVVYIPLGGASTLVGDAVVVYWYRYSAQRSSPEAASAVSPPIGWGGEDAHALTRLDSFGAIRGVLVGVVYTVFTCEQCDASPPVRCSWRRGTHTHAQQSA